jgi:hypothetical protein
MLLRHLVLVLPLAFASLACQATKAAHADGGAAKAEKEGDDDEESPADKLAAQQAKLEEAKLELKIAKADVEASMREAADKVADAEFALKMATEARDHFTGVELPHEVAKEQLDLEQAAWGAEEDRQELEELKAMYQKDDVAKLTKELVLQRGQKRLEFSGRRLENAQKELAIKRDFELARKQRELDHEVLKAENALREARAALAKAEDEKALKLRQSERGLADVEREIQKLSKKAAKA